MLNPTSPQELNEFFEYVVDTLEFLGIPYMVAGGFAAIFYGEPRLTIDVDILVDLRVEQIKLLLLAFPAPQYYLNEEALREALRRRRPFNVIQVNTGAKADLVPLPHEPFSRTAFSRRQQMAYNSAGKTAFFISVEDIVLAKLYAYVNTQSDKHLRDARGILVTQWDTINIEMLRYVARRTDIATLFEQVYQAAKEELS